MRPYLNSYRYEERTYRLFRDWLERFRYDLDNMAGDWTFIQAFFDGCFANTEGEYDNIYMDSANSSIANELLNKYIIPRYYNWAIGWVDGEEPDY